MNVYKSYGQNRRDCEENRAKETNKYSAPRLEARGNELVVVRSK